MILPTPITWSITRPLFSTVATNGVSTIIHLQLPLLIAANTLLIVSGDLIIVSMGYTTLPAGSCGMVVSLSSLVIDHRWRSALTWFFIGSRSTA
ncbi:MAG TPA: hypothetical protein EYP33_07995 [Pyrodictium sp.]|nr:hypothetical protein [Pyrodictium sp.]